MFGKLKRTFYNIIMLSADGNGCFIENLHITVNVVAALQIC